MYILTSNLLFLSLSLTIGSFQTVALASNRNGAVSYKSYGLLVDAEFQRRQFLERMGEAFLLAVLDEYCGALQSLGSDLFGFLQNLGSVYQEMKTTGAKDQGSSTSSVIANRYDISFSCVPEQGRLTLHFRTAVAACGYLWAGILKVSDLPSSISHLAS